MKVFSNLASSLDAKIALHSKPHMPLGTSYDRLLMQKFRKQCDIILFGAETLRVMKKPAKLALSSSKSINQPANAVFTLSGKLPPKMPFWTDNSVKRFIFTTKTGFVNAVKSSKGRAFIIVINEKKAPYEALVHLKKLGFKSILLEGGGKLMWEFLNAKCLHELNLTLVPKILGEGKNSSLVNGPSFSKIKNLSLEKVKKVGDELYMSYKVKGSLRI